MSFLRRNLKGGQVSECPVATPAFFGSLLTSVRGRQDKDVHSLTPRTCEYVPSQAKGLHRRDEIPDPEPEPGKHPRFSGWAQCNLQAQRKRCEEGSRGWKDSEPWAKGYAQPSELEKARQGFCLEPPEGTRPPTLTFAHKTHSGLLTARNVGCVTLNQKVGVVPGAAGN